MTPEKLLQLSLLYYFLPKLALFLPLCWMAAIFWWADKKKEPEAAPTTTESSEKEPQDESWYQHLLGSSDRDLPRGDWL
jgi:hypothetical protein